MAAPVPPRVARAGPRRHSSAFTSTRLDRLTRSPRGTLVAEAPVVVLAAGAVGTPVILQRSGFGGGGVGRFLRLHPTTAVAGEWHDDVYAAAGIPQSAVCDEFIRRDDHGYGFWIECAPHHPGLAAVAAAWIRRRAPRRHAPVQADDEPDLARARRVRPRRNRTAR